MDEFTVVRDPHTGRVHFLVEDTERPIGVTQCGIAMYDPLDWPATDWPVDMTRLCADCAEMLHYTMRYRSAHVHA